MFYLQRWWFMPGFSIGKLAKASGVSIDTIRFYEKSGLLPAAERRPSGFRLYRADDVRQLIFIREARGVGFSLQEIADLLRLVPPVDAALAVHVIESKLLRIEAKLAELQRWQHMLHELHGVAASSTSLTESIIDFFDSDVRDAMADLQAGSRPSPRGSHDAT